LALLTAGDLGMAYASPEEQAAGMWGLTIGSITGACSEAALMRIGQALYHNRDAAPQAPHDYVARIRATTGSINAFNTAGIDAPGVGGRNGYGRTRIGRVTGENFLSAVSFTN